MPSKLVLDTMELHCRNTTVIACIDLTDKQLAQPVAKALVKGGVTVMQIGIHAKSSAAVINQMASVPGALVGARNVMSTEVARVAQDAGAQFCSTGGVADNLLRYFDGVDIPLLPGTATTSEAMRLMERGYTFQKFYPAEYNGGPKALGALGAAIPQVKFCAGGGITQENMLSYLNLPNTLCVACDWLTPQALIRAKDWDGITALASKVSKMKSKS